MAVHLAGELKYTCQRIPDCSTCYSPKSKAETYIIVSVPGIVVLAQEARVINA